jgi:AraC-like DNA-binding protein
LIPRATLRKLCQARDLIRDCLAEPLTLPDIAQEVELSSWHLLRSFRVAFGETPHEFLTRLRIEAARNLLTVSSRSVTEVCFDVGFSSLGSFITLFTRVVGLSPGRYRRLVRSWVAVPGAHPWAFVPGCFACVLGGSKIREDSRSERRYTTPVDILTPWRTGG